MELNRGENRSVLTRVATRISVLALRGVFIAVLGVVLVMARIIFPPFGQRAP